MRIFAHPRLRSRGVSLESLDGAVAEALPHIYRRRLIEEAETACRRVRELFLAGRIDLPYVPDGVLSRAEIEESGIDGEQDGRTIKPFVSVATEASRRQRDRRAAF